MGAAVSARPEHNAERHGSVGGNPCGKTAPRDTTNNTEIIDDGSGDDVDDDNDDDVSFVWFKHILYPRGEIRLDK